LIWDEFVKRRPEDAINADHPLYLQGMDKRCWQPSLPYWFKSPIYRDKDRVYSGMGKNRIGELTTMKCEQAGVARKTPHAARYTCVKNLRKEGIAPHIVKQISGHKNDKSIDTYDKVDMDEQLELNQILTKRMQPSSSISASSMSSSARSSLMASSSAMPSQRALVPHVNAAAMPSQRALVPHVNAAAMPSQHAIIPQYNHQTVNHSLSTNMESLFSGAVLNNCVINVNFPSSQPRKRRRVIYDSDSD